MVETRAAMAWRQNPPVENGPRLRARLWVGAALVLAVLAGQSGLCRAAPPAAPSSPPHQSAPAPSAGPATQQPSGMMPSVENRVDAMRGRTGTLAAAAGRWPFELSGALERLYREVSEVGLAWVLSCLTVFLLGGIGAEALFKRATRRVRQRIIDAPLDSVRERVKVVLIRFVYSFLILLTFSAGSLGAFLIFDWPPFIRSLLLGYLVAFVLVRLALVIGRFALAPGAEKFRLLPVSTSSAWFYDTWLTALVAVTAFGWQTTSLLDRLGFSEPDRILTGHAVGLIAVVMAIAMAWSGRHLWTTSAELEEAGGTAGRLNLATLVPAFATLYLPVVWLLFLLDQGPVAWLLIVAVALPGAIAITRRVIANLLRPMGHAETAAPHAAHVVVLERGVRAVLMLVAALVLVHAWELDVAEMTSTNTLATRVIRGALYGVIIFLAADLLWQLIKMLIDRHLVEEPAETEDGARQLSDNEIGRRARLRTLLPILRNMLFVALLVIAVLMALSSAGVEIAPLLAGAGVIGIAIGFGAQTLVKDIISGVFFLLDDAFRVGEYIESGTIRGTVEAFSLRSVKLRHHRGQLHTVPFGDLKVVTNYSRDWVIDKIQVGVTYDTDLDQVKKIVKQVSKEIMEDPAMAAVILEPLKSQGVAQMGDFAIQIRMKIKTKPNEQFVIRRVIYDKIKKAFDANGIKFAFPTVTVAGGGDGAVTSAVAKQAIEIVQRKPAAQ